MTRITIALALNGGLRNFALKEPIMTPLSPFGERSLTVVAASFSDREGAETAASTLLKETLALYSEVEVISPGDPSVDQKVEPEGQGIWRTLIRSHVLFGITGAAIGVAVALMVIAAHWPAAAMSPAYTALFLGVLGAFFGMIFAGLLTLRPDHGYVINKVHEFSGRGQWAVVVRPLNESSSKAAYTRLVHAGTGAVRSL